MSNLRRGTRSNPCNADVVEGADADNITSKRRRTDPPKRFYCCVPTCPVRLKNGSQGRRIEANSNHIHMNSKLYDLMRDSLGYEFTFEAPGVICAKCHITLKNSVRISGEDGLRAFPSTSCRSTHAVTRDAYEDKEQAAVVINESPVPSSLSSEVFSEELPELAITIAESCSSEVDVQTEKSNTQTSTSSTFGYNPNSKTFARGDIAFLVPGIPSVVSTERKCCICGLNGRKRIPFCAILDAFVKRRIHIPPNNRCCSHYLEEGRFTQSALTMMKAQKRDSYMTGKDVAKWMTLMANHCIRSQKTLDFSGDLKYTDEVYRMLLGVGKSEFEIIHSFGSSSIRNSKNRCTRNAVAMLLMKLRLNISQRIIAFLFDIKNQSVVSDCIRDVLRALMASFVPKHLGYGHMSRDELKTYMCDYFARVLGLPLDVVIAILDGTYLDAEKSSIFDVQSRSYSEHKRKNLFKPMIVCCPDGHVLEVEGLYFSNHDNNDAKIFESMLKREDSIMTILEEGDAVILDRGFRDSISIAEEKGLKAFMPSCVQRKNKSNEGQKQFSPEEANSSRKVTLLRRIVEQVNGRIKNIFPFFDHKIRATYFKKLNAMFRTAVAIINAFSPPLFHETEFTDFVAGVVEDHDDDTNALMDMVIENKWATRRVIWEKADEDCCLEFPTLTLQDMKELTLGTYQIKMGLLYNENHIANGSGYEFFIHKEDSEIIRVKLQSRFSRRKVHNVWIQFKAHENTKNGILEWYCQCKNGARTLGSCSHVAAVIRYLAIDRFEPPRKREDVSKYFLDAAAALAAFADNDESEDEDISSDSEDEDDELLSV